MSEGIEVGRGGAVWYTGDGGASTSGLLQPGMRWEAGFEERREW